MKKFLRIVCCALLCIILLWGSIPVRGDSANEVKLLYTIVNGRVIITGCEGEAEFLEIPQVIDSYVLNAIMKISDFGFTAATTFFQSVVGLLLMLFANWMVNRISPENALF